MITRHLGTPLLGMGLLFTLAGCGNSDDDTGTKPPPVNSEPEDTYDPDPRRPVTMFWTGYIAWDSVEGEVRSFTEQGQEVPPHLSIRLQSQYVPDSGNGAPEDYCFVEVDLSGATVSDWDEDGTYPLALEVPAGAAVTHECTDWDFSRFEDPATLFGASAWRLGLGAADLDSEYKTWLDGQNFWNNNNPDHFAGGYIEFVDGWTQPRIYVMGYEVEDDFSLKIDNDALVRIDKYSMPGANGLVNGVYVLGTHWGWRLE